MRRRLNGIELRIAVSALLVAVVAMGVLAVGVVVVGGQAFADLMAVGGIDVGSSESMFQDSVVRVVVGALVIAVGLSLVLAMFIGRRLARPLRDAGDAAQRIARGDYASRLPRQGPDEIVTLADSFNQMAESLQEQRRIRDQFIADAAHELRTPLTNLQGYLEAMRDGVIAAEPAAFESLLEETGRLVRLARSLDTLAEGDAGRVMRTVEVDLGALLGSSVELAEPQMRSRGVRLELRLPERLIVLGDPDALLQVLGNLLQNAARYTPTGGNVAVWAGLDDTLPEMAVVSVSNTGPGIPAADLPHVFERFYRVDKSRSTAGGGAGIGLAIVQMLVEANGGTVGAESADGLTRFWFSVPLGSPERAVPS
jgi:two-component system sensor histidine kinase BaeS